MSRTALNSTQRAEALADMAAQEVDLLVVGGGVTGAGIALDGATRGLRVALVEAQDWAGGTSQWSSKLVHGGLRYLYQLNFALVAEALKERGLLLTRTAPHLVKAQPFLWPLKNAVVERSYSALGVGMYDILAQYGGGGRSAVPSQRHYSKEGATQLFPGIRADALAGAIRFFDARVDDARLVIDLVRTAVGYGALAASRAQVTGFIHADGTLVEHPADTATNPATSTVANPSPGPDRAKRGSNRPEPDSPSAAPIAGALVCDLETGTQLQIRARYTITATGVWTQQTQELADASSGLQVLASKGVHIVVPKERINGQTGIFIRTEKSVLFIIPWQRYWIIGTTDTAWDHGPAHPVPTAADIDYILAQANTVLADPLDHNDIIGTYAGLRPLLQPKTTNATSSTKASREHTITQVAPGLGAIAGGKLTTYRIMAADAIDFALTQIEGERAAKDRACITERIPLVGAAGYPAWQAQRDRIAADYGWTGERVQHLLDRYGDELPLLLDTVEADHDLGRPLAQAPAYLRVEVAFAITHEGALHVEDILRKRVRLDYEHRDRGLSALPEIAEIAAPLLGWDQATTARETDSYRARVQALAAAENHDSDAAALAARLEAPDIVPMR